MKLALALILLTLELSIRGSQTEDLSFFMKKRPFLHIINGKNATITKYPFMASLLIGGKVAGSGVVIDKSWILTNGFSLYNRSISDLQLRVGSTFYDKGGQVLEIEKTIVNEHFKPGSWDCDIGLVKVKPIKIGRNVKIIELGSTELTGGTKASIAGWGERKETGLASEHLLAINVTVLDRKKCAETFKKELTPRMLCTFDQKVGPCTGDFGDPLIVGNAVYGLYSGGYHCTPGKRPVVYANVPLLADWIKHIVENE